MPKMRSKKDLDRIVKGTDYTRRELQKSTGALIVNIRKRLKRISVERGRGGIISTLAIRDFSDILNTFLPVIKGKPRTLGDINDEVLKDLKRKLEELSGKRYSYVEGARDYEQQWTPVKKILDKLPKFEQDRFWEIYSKARSLSGIETMEKFKYDIFSQLADYVEKRKYRISKDDTDDLAQAISIWIKQEYENLADTSNRRKVADTDGLSTPRTFEGILLNLDRYLDTD